MNILKKPITWILFLALALRLWGITYGFPFFLVNDETPHVYGALKMIELETLIPAFHQEEFKKVLYYPPLTSYVFLPVLLPVIGAHWIFSGLPPLAEYKSALALDPSFIWIAARIFMALIGVLNVFVVYLFTRRVFQSERAGMFAALFLALSFYHIQLSHNVRHWLPASFLLTLVWFFSTPIFQGNASWRRYLGIGMLVGAAAGGVNTAAVIGLIPPFFASVFRNGVVGRKRIEGKKLGILFLSFALIALFFIVLHPYGFTRAEGAANPSADVSGRFVALAEKSFSGWIDFAAEYVGALWNFEAPLFLAGGAGVFLLFFQRRWFWGGTFLAYVFSFFTLLYLFDDFTARGIVFVTPILAVFAGYAVDAVFRNLKARIFSQVLFFVFCLLFSAVLFGWQFITDVRYDYLLSQKDTRLVARRWTVEHIPAGSRIVLDAQYLRLTNAKRGIEGMRAIDPASLRAADTALAALSNDRYPYPAYDIVNLNFVSKEKRSALSTDNFFKENGFEFLIVEYNNADAIPEDTRRLIGGGQLIRRISQWKGFGASSFDGSGKMGKFSVQKLFQVERFGFFVDIYKL